jgi:hypothetical protein
MIKRLTVLLVYKRSFFTMIFLCLRLTFAFSQSSFSFLNTPSNARLAALGGVNVSLADRDINLFTNNAALTSDTLTGQTSANYQFYLADIGHANFTYQHGFRKIGALAFAVQHLDYGSIKSYDASGAELGNFNSGETALTAGKQFQANDFRFGANVKAVFSNLAGFRASALGIDIGGLFIHPKHNFTVGLAFRNIGFTVHDYSTTSKAILPFDVQVGTTFKPEHMPFRFSITAFNLTNFETVTTDAQDNPSDVDKVVSHLNLATELLLSKSINILVSYNFQKRQELKLQQLSGGAGFSFGISAQIKSFEVVFSRASYGPQQPAFGFTISTNLNTIINKRIKI